MGASPTRTTVSASRADPSHAGTATPAATTARAAGEQLYQRCATCHQANGQGVAGIYPPLAGSGCATAANAAVPIRIVLHGLEGPATVKGVQFNAVMPAYGTGVAMTDDEVAAVVTCVRRSWGNVASLVTAQDVARERAATASAGTMTADALKLLM